MCLIVQLFKYKLDGPDYIAHSITESGWQFGEDYILYRVSKLFDDDHSEGNNWMFGKDDLEWRLLDLFKEEGYEIHHNGGDEDDALLYLKKK